MKSGRKEGIIMKSVAVKKVAIIVSVVLMQATMGYGAVVDGIRFEKQFQFDETTLNLRGAGVLRYMIFIKAYAGAFYLPEGTSSEEALADVPKRIEVEYYHALKGKDFGPATIEAMKKNVDPVTLERVMPQVEYHNSLYVDVNPGDRYALTYIPGEGTTLSLNGVPIGTIDGAEFAAALFSIWLGPNPISGDFKQALLGMTS